MRDEGRARIGEMRPVATISQFVNQSGDFILLCIALSAVRLYTTLAGTDVLAVVCLTCEFLTVLRCVLPPFNFWPHALMCDIQMNISQQYYILTSTPRLATSHAYEAMCRQIPAGIWFPVGMSYIIIS